MISKKFIAMFFLALSYSTINAMEDWFLVKSEDNVSPVDLQEWSLINSAQQEDSDSQSKAHELFLNALKKYAVINGGEPLSKSSDDFRRVSQSIRLENTLKTLLHEAQKLEDAVYYDSAFDHLCDNLKYKTIFEGIIKLREKIQTDHTRSCLIQVWPHGKSVISGSQESMKMGLWNIERKELIKNFWECQEFAVSDRCFAVGDPWASHIILKDISIDNELENIRFLGSHKKSKLCFSPDGNYLASASDDCVKLWDVLEEKCVHIFDFDLASAGFFTMFRSVCFSPDGKLLAFSIGKMIILWDVASRERLHTFLNCHKTAILAIRFSPDGSHLVSASHHIKLWDIISKKRMCTLKGHTNQVSSLDFSPNSKYLVSGSWDQTLRVWVVAARQCIQVIRDYNRYITSVCFLPDGSQFVSSSHNSEKPMVNTIGIYTFYKIKNDFRLLPLLLLEYLTYKMRSCSSEKISLDSSQCDIYKQLPEQFQKKFLSILDEDVLSILKK